MAWRNGALSWRTRIFLLTVLLIFMSGMLLGLSPLLETKEAYAQSGSISGRVTSASEPDGVFDVGVYVYDEYGYYVTYGWTDEDGYYETWGDIPTGDYKVEFDPPWNSDYITQWYQGKGSSGEADTVSVTAGTTTGDIDAVLEEGGKISGRVTSASEPDGVAGVEVDVYDYDEYSWITSCHTDEDGYYQTRGVMPTGDYKVRFSSGNYLSQWYRNKNSFDTADTVHVTAGATTSGIDATLGVGGKIAGRVTSASEPDGVFDVGVYVYDEDWDYVTNCHTDEDGYYETRGVMPTGDYKVEFDPYGGDYLSQWYRGKDSFEVADTVSVTAGATTGGIDAILEEGGKISGRVTSASEPDGVFDVGVYVYDEDWDYVTNCHTDEDGYYETRGVMPTGDYKVEFDPYGGDYLSQWYRGKDSFEVADTVSVTAGATTSGIDATLGVGGKIAGRVTSASEPDGVFDVGVYVYDEDWDYVTNCHTDEDGYYETRGVMPTGDYKVEFDPYGGDYLSQWYRGKDSFEVADTVSVTAGATTGGIDAILEEGGKISGRVTSASEPDGVGDVNVSVYDEDGGHVANCYTYEDGYYETWKNIPAGDYKVEFDPLWNSDYLSQWYRNKNSFDTADTVHVTAGATTSGIDATLGVGGKIAGRVTSASEPDGVFDVGVYVYDEDWDYVTNCHTDEDGYYETWKNIPAGDYKVEFDPPYGSDYVTQWYRGKGSFEGADIVAVIDGEITQSIDAQLQLKGSISGKVTGDMHPKGVLGVMVTAYDAEDNACGSDWTGQDGRYRIPLEPGLYRVRFHPYYVSVYGDIWYGGKPDFDSADIVEVLPELETSGIDAFLISGSISGTVASSDEPDGVAKVDILVYDENGEYAGSAVTAEDGSYRVKGLRTGDYFAYAYPWWPNANDGRSYAFEWHEDKGALEDADPVEVVVGNDTAGVDFELESGSISGKVTGWDAPEGLEGIDVYVHDAHFHLVGTALTATGGTYTVKGIRPGDYTLYFDPSAMRESGGGDYTGEYYSDKESFFDADAVSVAGEVSGIDAALEAAGYISGTVTSGGSAAPGVFVHAYRASDPTFWLGYAETDESGEYTIGNLAPGDYLVSFNHASGQNYRDEWYDDAQDPGAATAISLVRGEGGIDGIDADLATGGSVSGRVTGSDAPGGLEGVQVRILDSDYAFIGGTLSAADGSYAVGGLPAGEYCVEFYTGDPASGAALNYRGEFYNGQAIWDEADLVSVEAGTDTPLEDAVLERLGSISGRVTASGSVEGVRVVLYDGSGWQQMGSTVIDACGEFLFERLKAGDYTLHFDPANANKENATDYSPEWYEDKASPEAASVVTIGPGEDASGIDAALERRGRIAGRVTGGDASQGVPNIVIAAVDDSGNDVSWARTDSEGYYAMSLKPGTYKVYAELLHGYDWYDMWYEGKSMPESADPVVVSEGKSAKGIDFHISGIGSISGKVTSDKYPGGLAGAKITAYHAGGKSSFAYTYADEEGNYLLENLPAGDYHVFFSDEDFFAWRIGKWFDGKAGRNAADIVSVSEGATVEGVDAHFSGEVSISGRVTSAFEPGGVPDIGVYIYSEDETDIAYCRTGAGGYYEVAGGIPAGDYKIRFSPPWDSDYLSQWYQGKESFEAADTVAVALGAPASNIDATLVKGGSITGRITGYEHPGGVTNYDIYAYDMDNNRIYRETTDDNGTYRFTRLPAGEYKVKFADWYYDWYYDYIPIWYDNQPDSVSAETIVVPAGEEVPGIDAHLQTYASISGRATSSTEPGGVEGVHVYAYDADNPDSWISYAVTGSSGAYNLGRLRPGDYKVAFSPVSGMNYAEEWYEGQADFASATTITLASGEARADIDADLGVGGSISGKVASRVTPGGIGGVGITAYTLNGEYARACHTEEDGTYFLGSLATGEYLVFFEPGSLPYKGKWYEDSYDRDSASPVKVTFAEETIGIDCELGDGGSISGVVTSDSEPGGVGGIAVNAYRANDARSWAGRGVSRGDGTYIIEGLAPGEYRVVFNSSLEKNYSSSWYEDGESFGEALTVAVQEKLNTGNIDCHLLENGTISGRVTGSGGLKDVRVRFYLEGSGESAFCLTDSEGYYEKAALPGGNYRVFFDPPDGSPYLSQWYQGKASKAEADVIELSYGEKRENVDAELVLEPSEPYTISAAASPPEGGAVTGAGDYRHGLMVSLSATSNAGYTFTNWTEGEEVISAKANYSFVATANRSLVANFTLNSYTITASAGEGGSIDPSGDVAVKHGKDQSFAITPNKGYHIAEVKVDGKSVGAVSTYEFKNMTAGHEIAATFALIEYTITASAGAGGSIDPAGAVAVKHGKDRSFAITPGEGYRIADVLVDGESVGAVSTYEFKNVTADHEIAATFAKIAPPPPATTWYLAEGCTEGGMETWVLVQNPGTSPVTVDLILQTSSGEQRPAGLQGKEIPAGSRSSFNIGEHWRDWDVSTKVVASGEVICERAMYGPGRAWAHDSVGVTAPAKTWYLAEGCTEGGMETWVLVQNPGTSPVTVDLILQTSSGEQRPAGLQGKEIPAGSRSSFNIGEHWRDWDVSTKVVASGEVICERAMYGPGRIWAHDSVGVTAPAKTWYLAEGCTEGGMETWVLVQNPGTSPLTVDLILQTSSGEQRPAGLQGKEIPAGSRSSFNIGEHWRDWDVSTKVVASGEVICERAMYGPGRMWAHDSVGYAP